MFFHNSKIIILRPVFMLAAWFLYTLDLDSGHGRNDTEHWVETTLQYDRYPTKMESGV